MAISNAEWWMRWAVPLRPEVSIPDRLKQAVELMAANVGQAISRLVDPPYTTPDGKPLEIHFYEPGESTFTPRQMDQLTAIAKTLSHQE